jgi:hypothetical protein
MDSRPLALLCALLVAAYATAAERQPAGESQRILNEGYSLLYDHVSKQKQSDKILLIKLESKDVKALITEISDNAERIQKALDKLAAQDPRLEVKLQSLPEIEAESRKSASFERLKDLLAKSGKEFERLLLLTQSGVLNTERHLSKVLSKKETNRERKAFLEDVNRQFDDDYRKVVQLLEAQYFKPITRSE